MTNSVTSPVQKKVVGIHQLFITIVFKSHIISNWGGGEFYISGSAVSIKRGCKSSVSASSSSSGGGFASSWSQSCSTDLCNSGDGTGFSFQMPDMSGFNIFKGFNGNNQQQQWQSSRNANAAPGSLYCQAEWL